MKKIAVFFVFILIANICNSQNKDEIKVGAEQPENYINHLENRTVGLVANHTSLAGEIHLLDFLLQKKIDVKVVFAPEHGFRGEASAGEIIKDGVDVKTGVKVVSLYGKNKKPEREQLKGIDIIVFDIQDVGCRFYTYISTLHYVIEACAENNIPLLIFDRPNPNGDYVAGPMLKEGFQSFVGMDPIPVVHGCTIGEMALMINGESWHKGNKKCNLSIITVKGYDHNVLYSLPVKPSPNLPNDIAVRLYPSLCFFEATSVSIGRGTDFPFQVIGYPDKRFGSFTFTPEEIKGVALNPKQEGMLCYGDDLRKSEKIPEFTLSYFLKYYRNFENKSDFLTNERWLNLLSGSDELIQLLRQNKNEEQILEIWQKELAEYKEIRRKYLLYPDFE